MSKKPQTAPSAGGGLARFFGAPKSASSTKSLFDDENFDDFNSASSSSTRSSSTKTTTANTPTKPAPAATTPQPAPAQPTPSSAVKHARPTIDNDDDDDSDDDQVVIKKAPPANKSVKPSSPIVKRPKSSKFAASTSEEAASEDDSSDSGYSSDDGSTEDDSSGSDESSFASESEDEGAAKPARGAAKAVAKGRAVKAPSKGGSLKTVAVSTSEDESNADTMSGRGEDSPRTVAPPKQQSSGNGAVQFAAFINTGAPRQPQQSPFEIQSTPSKPSKTPLLANTTPTLTNFFDRNEDSDNDAESAPTSQSNQGVGSNQVGLNALDYKLPSFVHADKIRDKQKRRPDHPDYDPRTLYIPPEDFKVLTGASRQFWEMKSENMDVVLLFKVGKFYELFDLDAEVGVKELGLSRMGTGDRLHVGFPEAGYAKYATILVKRGYKVACGDQVQTPEQMKEANAKLPRGVPKQTVVDRHICSFVTPGTGVQDEFLTTSFNTYLLAIMEYPLHKTQSQIVNDSGDVTFNRVDYRDKDCIYGVCFVDTSTGTFQAGSFIDNTNKSSFKALLAQVNPAELLSFKDSLSIATETILRSELPPSCIRTPLPKNEKLDSTRCISQIASMGYFKPPSATTPPKSHHSETASKIPFEVKQRAKVSLANIDTTTGWPNVLQRYKASVNELDQLGDSLDEAEFQERFQLNETFWGAFGLIFMYLKRTLLDKELIPLCKFKQYVPIESVPKQLLTNQQLLAQQEQLEASEKQQQQQQQQLHHAQSTIPSTTPPPPQQISIPAVSYDSDAEHLVLDAQTLANLEILVNGEGSVQGTLLSYIDHCSTSFGKRLLHKWLIRPLFDVRDINNRLDTVTELIENFDLVQTTAKKLSKVPDLERMLARIRANGLKKDINAIMYGDVGKVQVDLFLKCLDGFEVALGAVTQFLHNQSNHIWSSQLLKDLSFIPQHEDISVQNDDNPNIFALVQQLLVEFRDSFDHRQAQKDGYITPRDGVVDDFDEAKNDVIRAEHLLAKELQNQRAKFGNSQSIIWCHKNKETYQLEIPVELISRYPKVIDNTYEQASSTTKVRRFYTSHIKALAKQCDDAKARKDEVLKDVTRQVFEKFSLDYSVWAGVVDSLSSLDCLFSLATASYMQHSGVRTVRPAVLAVNQTPTKKPLLELRNAIHPTVAKNATFAQYSGAPQSYIPNDTDLGTDFNPSRFILVSGPNMGGKSSLLRQVCCCIILAQIGCYVPAESMKFTPIDRIFTRVGANDRIMQGQSTFLVELEETSHILRHATPRSFVILDELGRGTSTFDGTAIAYSVIQYLSQIVQCMTLFSTHYHMLLQEYRNNPLISMYHMACKVHNENEQASGTVDCNKHIQRITFLYKFVPGTCNKSFGLHVAALAKLPALVIDRAYEKGEWFSICFEQPDNDPTKLLKRIIIALHHNDFFALKKLRQQFAALQAKQ